LIAAVGYVMPDEFSFCTLALEPSHAELLCAVLNSFAGFLHVFAEAAGGVAANPGDGEEGGDE
jgi:hypothetical protein